MRSTVLSEYLFTLYTRYTMIREITKNVKNAMTGIVEPKEFETELTELHKRDPKPLDDDEYVLTLGELFPKNVDDRVVLMVLLLEQKF
jgi:hypothetical protein